MLYSEKKQKKDMKIKLKIDFINLHHCMDYDKLRTTS